MNEWNWPAGLATKAHTTHWIFETKQRVIYDLLETIYNLIKFIKCTYQDRNLYVKVRGYINLEYSRNQVKYSAYI